MKNYIFGLLTGVVLVVAVVIPYLWPPEFSMVFNTQFWSAVLVFAVCMFVVGLLFYTNGGSSRGVRFYFGLNLILAAALLYYGLDEIAKNADLWKPLFSHNYSRMFVSLTLILIYAKNIVSFGFAAIGASLAANAISENIVPATVKRATPKSKSKL